VGSGEQPGGRVLLVDDDEEGLDYARAMLEAAGWSVTAVSNAAAACEELRRGEFSVLVSDLRLATASGLDVISFAREHSPLCVGIIITAYGSVDSALQALREGAFDYVLKPFTADILLAAVRRAREHHLLRTALVDRNSRLEETQSRLGRHLRLLENISHEFKNPLSVVYGYATHLLRQELDPSRAPEVRQGLSTIRKGAERLTALLGDLLDAVRLSNGKLELQVETVRALDLIQETAAEHRLAAEAKSVALDCAEPADAGLTVRADVLRVYQILSNLIANALKFTRAGGRVSLSIAAEEGFVRFCVRDTGQGIAPQDLALIFERFYQARRPQDQQPGLGLGLEISRGLVELHGGRIWAESVVDRGSAFYFTLPLAR
jgi:signal transduction histidine kinase